MKSNKKLFVLSVLPLIISACGSTVVPPSPDVDKVNLFYAYSHENLLSNLDYWKNNEYKNRGYDLKFECLRGENDGVQLVMAATDDITNFDFEVTTELTDPSGNVIGKENIDIFAEWYTYLNVTNEINAYAGYYPDALVPLANYKMRQKDFVAKGRNQALYINLKVPADAVPGDYEGYATLTVDEKEYQIPLYAKVHNDVMPTENHFRSCFLIWYDQIPIGEKENDSLELQEKYYNFTVSKRLSPDGLPDYYESTPAIFAEKMVEIANDERISGYRFPVQAAHDNILDTRIDAYMNALINKNIELRRAGDNKTNLFEKLYFYIDDEPSSESYPRVRRHDKICYEAKKAARDKLAGYPDLQASVMNMENIVTTPYNSQLIATESQGGVQTWCPQFDEFRTETQRATYKFRQQFGGLSRTGGENVWWYGCISPKGVYPSYHLNADSIYSRIIPYMQYNYGIEGEIYWNMCYYSKYQGGTVTSRDVWYDAITWESCAGDGALVYPGYEFNLKSPISTLRLENILAGNEEYEYLYLLNNYLTTYNNRHSTNHSLNTLLKKEYATIFTDVKPSHENGNVEQVRRHLLTALDKFSIDIDEGFAYLESLGN